MFKEYFFSLYSLGTCIDRIAEYVCECPLGFQGVNCQEVITFDPCEPNPCQNSGFCCSNLKYECANLELEDKVYQCLCPTQGFAG